MSHSTNLSQEEIENAKKHFSKFDEDNSNTIDKAELKKLLEETLSTSLSDSLYSKYVSMELERTDTNKDGELQFEEFLKLYERLKKNPELPIGMKAQGGGTGAVKESSAPRMAVPKQAELTEEDCQHALTKFKEFDKDGNGTISRDELKDLLLTTMSKKSSSAMVDRVVNMHMNSADKDGNDEIDKEEFLTVYAKVFKKGGSGGPAPFGMPMMGMPQK
eukprot:gb/GECH01009764.1/.p1 GENE.gb/GECH01009764.1/~~gb/GECH01009764.1/.p1  ORF type:complete len:218 (+),score=44.85 gb/GECH01009764.1/:1-654(+)